MPAGSSSSRGPPNAIRSAANNSTFCSVSPMAESAPCSRRSAALSRPFRERAVPADRTRLAELVGTVGAFHVTDRTLRAAQERIEARLAAGGAGDAAIAGYLDPAGRSFAPY